MIDIKISDKIMDVNQCKGILYSFEEFADCVKFDGINKNSQSILVHKYNHLIAIPYNIFNQELSIIDISHLYNKGNLDDDIMEYLEVLYNVYYLEY